MGTRTLGIVAIVLVVSAPLGAKPRGVSASQPSTVDVTTKVYPGENGSADLKVSTVHIVNRTFDVLETGTRGNLLLEQTVETESDSVGGPHEGKVGLVASSVSGTKKVHLFTINAVGSEVSRSEDDALFITTER